MQIRGHGIDLVDVSRIRTMVEDHGERFLARIFTAAERDYAARSTKREVEHLAARFAAKEAALKALGTGWTRGIAWTEVEVTRHPGGRPQLTLHGQAATIAAEAGITHWWLSISHTDTHAIGFAVGMGVRD